MDSLPDSQYDRALLLKAQVTALATGGELTDWIYRSIRTEFLEDVRTKMILPVMVRSNVESAGLWAELKECHTGSGAYEVRRRFINEEFQPLLNYLLQIDSPADANVSDVVAVFNADGISDAWRKALDRRANDADGAITAARTLLEEVCKHILDDAGEEYHSKTDLPKLYSKTAKLMNLGPSQHSEEVFRKILGGCHAVVENLGEMRNKIGDAHGGGRARVKPAARHAALAVNLAGSVSMFLIETWADRRSTRPA